MKKFKIEFKHTVEQYYTAIVESETKEKAVEIWEDSPFDYLENDEPYVEQGLKLNIVKID